MPGSRDPVAVVTVPEHRCGRRDRPGLQRGLFYENLSVDPRDDPVAFSKHPPAEMGESRLVGIPEVVEEGRNDAIRGDED